MGEGSIVKLVGSDVLVTGATGFIGNLLVKKLYSAGCNARLLVRNKNVFKRDQYDQYQGDLLNRDTLIEAARGVKVVYHLAACSDSESSSTDAVEHCFSVNVESTRNLLSSLGSSIEHLIFFSSVYVYGNDSGENIDEGSPTNPGTAYGRSKLEAENIIFDWGVRNGVMTTCLRLPLVYGPGNKGNMLRMIDAIARRRFLILGKGDNKRSMVYVENVIDAAIAVALREEANEEVFNITDGNDYSMNDMYLSISKSLGVRPIPVRIPVSDTVIRTIGNTFDAVSNFSGIKLPVNSGVLNKLTASLTFSSEKIRKLVGFEPGYSLEEGMLNTVRWYRESKC